MPKPIHSSIRKDTSMRVRFSYAELSKIKAYAKSKKMTISEYMRGLIEADMNKPK